MDDRYAYNPSTRINTDNAGDSNLQLMKHYSEQIEIYKKVIASLINHGWFSGNFHKEMKEESISVMFPNDDLVSHTNLVVTKK